MIDIGKTALTFVKEMKENGFNGVEFERAYVELTEYEADQWENRQEFDDFHYGYAIFILNPIFDEFDLSSSSKYETSEIDHFGFEKDLKEEIYKRFGSDVTLNYFSSCGEIEVYREKQ